MNAALRRQRQTRSGTQWLGAEPLPNGDCSFRVWAPLARSVEVSLPESGRLEPLQRDSDGYHSAVLHGVPPGSSYLFRLDGERERPDPASRLQSDGVHGPSRVCSIDDDPHIGWRGVPLRDYVIYEIHVGTFSRAGTFAGVIPELARLRDLGVTAIEIMPVAQCPGTRNWGYDGVYPFAVQHSYGGPRGLQQLVAACHRVGLAVVLDVVYNHLGPEGNYLTDFGPYFTGRYHTPWGSAINFDGAESEGVRRYFRENALQWLERFQIDALRLDAIHSIIDRSAQPFLEELADAVRVRGEELGRHWYLIAESDLNDPRVVRSSALGGYGLDAMWCDDFHHAAHTLITGERSGYYADFGKVEDLARAFQTGMCNAGEYSKFRQRRHGRTATDLKPEQHVVCIQNHDQIGNRLLGERLATIVGFEQQKLAAGVLCLAPFVPLLFMGEEYGETAPFQYFVSHGDEALLDAIRKGRRDEFASFGWSEPAPDPAAEETFQRCKLDHELRFAGQHAALYGLYQRLLEVRQSLAPRTSDECVSLEAQKALFVQRDHRAWMVFCFSDRAHDIHVPVPPGHWRKLLSSADVSWQGPGCSLGAELVSNGDVLLRVQPHSFMCFEAVH